MPANPNVPTDPDPDDPQPPPEPWTELDATLTVSASTFRPFEAIQVTWNAKLKDPQHPKHPLDAYWFRLTFGDKQFSEVNIGPSGTREFYPPGDGIIYLEANSGGVWNVIAKATVAYLRDDLMETIEILGELIEPHVKASLHKAIASHDDVSFRTLVVPGKPPVQLDVTDHWTWSRIRYRAPLQVARDIIRDPDLDLDLSFSFSVAHNGAKSKLVVTAHFDADLSMSFADHVMSFALAKSGIAVGNELLPPYLNCAYAAGAAARFYAELEKLPGIESLLPTHQPWAVGVIPDPGGQSGYLRILFYPKPVPAPPPPVNDGGIN